MLGSCFCYENLKYYCQVTKIVTEREEKSFLQQKQNLVSLADDITQYW